jgi:hypothetical protein
MSVSTKSSVSGNVRTVTDEEVEQFRRDGWTKLEGLVSPELAT